MYCGSRTRWKKFHESNSWWKALINTPSLQNFCRDNPGVAVYGEIYGEIQDMRYNVPNGEIRFAAFDILKDGKWVDPLPARELAKDIPWVPTVSESFPFNFDKVVEIAEGDSLVPGDKPGGISEGVVCKPIIERVDYKVGRVCLKFVSLRYHQRKTN